MYQSSFPWRDAAERRPPPHTEKELLTRAAALTGRCIGELAAALRVPLPREPKRAKGFVGQLVELALGADPRAGEQPDFPSLGVELKTIPCALDGTPVESTFCCAISMRQLDRERWESSRLRHKLQRVLWVPVQAATVRDLPARRFGRPRLWVPTDAEQARLQADWEDLMGAIGTSGLDGISGRDGQVLQVRPKAARSDVRTASALADGVELALPVAFYLRAGFTAQILSHHGPIFPTTAPP